MPIFRPFFFSKNKPVWRISNTGKIVFACILPLDCLFCEGEIESCQPRHWPSASWIFPIFKNCAAYSARFELNMRQRTGKNAIIRLLLPPSPTNNVIFGRFKLNHSTYNCFIWIDLRAHQPQSHLPARDQPWRSDFAQLSQIVHYRFFHSISKCIKFSLQVPVAAEMGNQ